MKLDIDTHAYQEFVYYCEEIQLKIASRLKAHEQTLLGGAALFDASKSVERQEWYSYVERLRLNEYFNGIQGLGFALWIPPAQLLAHQANIRAEGFPDYTIRPKGEREAYSSIIFLEPFAERNLRAFGYDMYSEPVRRVAMARARDEDSVTLSGRVTLVQETDKDVQAGTLMYIPVYKKGVPIDTIDHRRAALFGWVYSPFRMTDLLNHIVSFTQESDVAQVRLRVYDGQNTQAEHLLYDNNAGYPDTESTHHSSLVQLSNDFNGTIWTLQFEQIIGANGLDYSKAWITLSTGVFISLLLFLLSNSYLNTRMKAASIAAKLTGELQESESRFRVLADSSPVLIWLIEPDKLCSYVNKVWLDFTGRTLEQELGDGWAEGVHADDLQRCMAVFISSFDARLPFTTDYRLRRYDGEYRWLLDTGTPRFADDGSFLGYIGSCIDITERKQAETNIEKSLSLLHATLESASDAILVVDLHNTWVLYNQNFIDLWGIPNEIIAAKDDEAALSYVRNKLEDEEGFLHKVHELYHTPEARSFDIINFKSGEVIERYSMPQRINGNVVGRVWSFRDITERTQSERALQRESEKNLALLRNASDGIHILNTEGNIIEVSDSFCAMLGYSRDEMVSMNVTRWDANFSPEECIKVVKQQFEKPVRALFQTRHRCKDGSIIDVEVSGFPLVLDGKPALFNSSRDITERKLMEEALKASEEKFRSIIDVSPVPMALIDNQQNIIFLNPAFINTFGYDLSNIPTFADWWLKAYPDSDYRQSVINTWQARLEQAEREQHAFIPLEITIQCKDGSQRIVLASATLISYAFSDVHLVVLYDITELKRVELARRVSEEQLQAFYELDLVGLAITSPEKGWIRINDCLCAMLGYSEQELHLMTWAELTYPDDLAADVKQFEKLLTNEINGYALEKRFVSHTGKIIPSRLVVRCVRKANGEVDYVMAMVEDITEYKQAEAELRIAATVFESQEGMFIADANEIILNVNKAFTQITGYSAAEVIGQTPHILYSERHNKEFYAALWQSIQNTGAWQGEIWNQRKNGDIYPEQLSITAVTGSNNTVTHYVATFSDITERKAMEEYIHRLAFYDALTQLPNRRLLQERLKHGIELNHRTGSQMAVLMMDLDRFKAVNDSLGHAAGDELLQQVAVRVKARLREVDMVARLGGDEFVILLENVSHYEDVAHVAQSIIDTLSQPFRLCQGHEVSIGATIGIGICPHHGSSVETLMDNADAALYHAKDQGRGCFAYFSEALTQKSHERLALESRLRGAVEQQELSLYFQPQIEMSSGRLVGAETLVYWDDSVKSCRIMLKDVIALAEETGVGVTIGEWALRETCKLGRQWLDAGLAIVPLAVNVSPYQFRSGNIKELVMQILEDTGFPAAYLSLEITETGLMANQEHALSILNSLDEQSVQLAINDFGTGYSSLSRLKYFPIDILKIDKTFIKNIPFSQDDNTITTTIIDMAHHLGFSVLAEGVDTSEQLAFLHLQGCDYYQGYLYSDALSPSDFAKLLFDSQSG
jgi:diguanylate cyclase (GGDEF)-like protein/PAS domain S-box-containing protein